jgi:flavin-dependent dehydrogenase
LPSFGFYHLKFSHLKKNLPFLKRIVIIGGGIAGLISSIQLAKAGISCTVFEKKLYPFHRVCGEYISNETIPFLKSLDLYPAIFNPPRIQRFQLSAVSGKNQILSLDLGGFGISRYAFDNFLYENARSLGVEFLLKEEVTDVEFNQEKFLIKSTTKNIEADIAIGCFGKRSRIDIQLNRSFIQKRSPYVGIKYHIKTDHPEDLIALHNFDGGYCGLSNVENGITNLCYLTHRDNVKKFKTIREMEERILYKNPLLKNIFSNSKFMFDRPETINEISFETKSPIENHVLMVGDAAGMITPLCGNGMAMAIHSSKILCELLIENLNKQNFSRYHVERNYLDRWNKLFKRRLGFGRQVQKLFGRAWTSNIAVNLAINVRPIAHVIMRSTHGDPF